MHKRYLAALGLVCLVATAASPQPTPAPAPQQPEEEYFGQYTPGAGFQVAKTELGELNGSSPTSQLNKVQISTFGCILSPPSCASSPTSGSADTSPDSSLRN